MTAHLSTSGKHAADTTRIGEASPPQPLSGVKLVDQTFAVNGLGRGAYVREKTNEQKKGENFRHPITEGRH